MKYLMFFILIFSPSAYADDDYDYGYNNSGADYCDGYSSYCNGVNDAIDEERKSDDER